MLACTPSPLKAHKALWDTLDVGYFMRHDAADIAWHTRQLSRDQAVSAFWTPASTRQKMAMRWIPFQVVTSAMPREYRELVQHDRKRPDPITEAGALPTPSRGRVSRRVKSFPVAPRVTWRRTKKPSAGCSAFPPATAYRPAVQRGAVLARHHINLQLAKITTLGERVEDTFLIDGPELQHNRRRSRLKPNCWPTRVSSYIFCSRLTISMGANQVTAPEQTRRHAAGAPNRGTPAAPWPAHTASPGHIARPGHSRIPLVAGSPPLRPPWPGPAPDQY
jgi:UTP:GlnB (protein PII) uridylyltransferase